MAKSLRKPINFQQKWIVRYGVRLSTRDSDTGKVYSVECWFRSFLDQYNWLSPGEKRMQTNHIQPLPGFYLVGALFSHGLNLLLQKLYSSLCDDSFVRTMTSMTGQLCPQFNLIAQMGSKCPRFVATWWIAMNKALKWLMAFVRVLENTLQQRASPGLLHRLGGLVLLTASVLWWRLLTLQMQNCRGARFNWLCNNRFLQDSLNNDLS